MAKRRQREGVATISKKTHSNGSFISTNSLLILIPSSKYYSIAVARFGWRSYVAFTSTVRRRRMHHMHTCNMQFKWRNSNAMQYVRHFFFFSVLFWLSYRFETIYLRDVGFIDLFSVGRFETILWQQHAFTKYLSCLILYLHEIHLQKCIPFKCCKTL